MATKKTEQTEEKTLSLEAVQAQIAEMLANAKAEAAQIVADAKTAAESAGVSAAADQVKAARAAAKAKADELVDVQLFKDNDRYKDDVFVAVNGENCLIQRGTPVKIKRKFAEVLEHSAKQDAETGMIIEAEEDKFAKESAMYR